jgi:hypothetical protein
MPRKPKASPTPKKAANVVSLPPIKKAGKHEPTQITRNLVMVGCLNGFTHEQIAGLLDIDPKTLRAHYADELATGKQRMVVKVASNLFSIATQTNDLKAALTASIFFLKTKGGWKEGADEVDPNEAGKHRNVVVSLNIGDKEPKTA